MSPFVARGAFLPLSTCIFLLFHRLFEPAVASSVSGQSPPIVAILSQPLNSPPTSTSTTSSSSAALNRNKHFHSLLQAYANEYSQVNNLNKHEYNATAAEEANKGEGMYYIAASYTKWLEVAGIRSVVLPYDASPSLTKEIFHEVNGLLLPGGAAALPQTVQEMWKLARQSNEKRDYFPVWGTCLGFEFMVQCAAEGGEDALQHGFDVENVSLPLEFVDGGYKEYEDYMYSATLDSRLRSLREGEGKSSTNTSLLFPSGSRVRKISATLNVTLNNHQSGIEPNRFLSDSGLTSMFRIISTNTDKKGRSFVSTIESVDPDRHPYYGVQFHPEKNMFENAFYPGSNTPFEDINHSPGGIEMSLHLAQFFGKLVRRNGLSSSTSKKHKYTDPVRHPLITTYPAMAGVAFEQIYIVPGAKAWR